MRNLGVQIEYLILPDNRNELVSHQHILDMLQGPLFKDGGVAGITFYLLISTCNSGNTLVYRSVIEFEIQGLMRYRKKY